MKNGLDVAADLIEARRRIVKETLPRFGATRKNQIKQAGQNAAMGWLADGVRRVTRKAHRREVTDLLQVILQTEVSEDRVAHAARPVSDKTVAAYNRFDLFERRRRLMQQWATFCTAPRQEAQSNIAPLRRKG